MASVYKMDHELEVAEVLERMRLNLSEAFGVTIVGNRCTLRWNMDGQLVDVHMIVENVTTPKEAMEAKEAAIRKQKFIDNYKKLFPNFAADLQDMEG